MQSTFAFDQVKFNYMQPVQYVTNEKGEKTGVLLKLSDYEQLMEDLHDLAAIAERREEQSVPHKEFLADLRKDGILQD
jgi:PHD/YefM family antitoxin component YafN of YafNO toxin-antitoxin module